MKKLLAVLALAVALIPVPGFAAGWQVLSSPEGRFSILLPGVPDHAENTAQWNLSTDKDTVSYGVGYGDVSSTMTLTDHQILDRVPPPGSVPII